MQRRLHLPGALQVLRQPPLQALVVRPLHVVLQRVPVLEEQPGHLELAGAALLVVGDGATDVEFALQVLGVVVEGAAQVDAVVVLRNLQGLLPLVRILSEE